MLGAVMISFACTDLPFLAELLNLLVPALVSLNGLLVSLCQDVVLVSGNLYKQKTHCIASLAGGAKR